ncbi:MAG: glycosyltransferase family 4 protein [Bacillota bacterium]|nr:glycosyltransferase family 4 protein [Bacillota bacterium]
MNILFIINSLGYGGAESLLKDLLPVLRQKGLLPEVLVLNHNSPGIDKMKDVNIPVFETGIKNVYSPNQISRIKKFIKANHYDLIHVHLFPSIYWFALAKKISRVDIKSIMTEHSTHNRRRNKYYFKLLDRFVYDSYEKIACISEPARMLLEKWLPEIQSKTITIYNGIDIRKFNEAEPLPKNHLAKGYKRGQKIILMVASLTPKKDHGTLIKAMNLLPNDYQLVLTGDGFLKNSYQEETKRLGLSDRVTFLGFRGDIERVMKAADIFVLSSHWEGFGLVAVEAMASGLPVLASDVQGLAEIVEGAGLLFPPGDERALANAINKVLSDEDLYMRMRKTGLEKASMFSLEKTADQYIRMYEEVLN